MVEHPLLTELENVLRKIASCEDIRMRERKEFILMTDRAVPLIEAGILRRRIELENG